MNDVYLYRLFEQKKIIVTKDKVDEFKNRKEKNKVKKVSFKDCELKDLKV